MGFAYKMGESIRAIIHPLRPIIELLLIGSLLAAPILGYLKYYRNRVVDPAETTLEVPPGFFVAGWVIWDEELVLGTHGCRSRYLPNTYIGKPLSCSYELEIEDVDGRKHLVEISRGNADCLDDIIGTLRLGTCNLYAELERSIFSKRDKKGRLGDVILIRDNTPWPKTFTGIFDPERYGYKNKRGGGPYHVYGPGDIKVLKGKFSDKFFREREAHIGDGTRVGMGFCACTYTKSNDWEFLEGKER